MQEKVVKLSMPESVGKKVHRIPLIGQTPGGKGVWGNYRFEINTDCDECDFWIVYESAVRPQKTHVKSGICLYLTGEVEHKPYPQEFLKQFDAIITSRGDLDGHTVIGTHYANAWFVNKSYDELIAMQRIPKTRELSMVVSSLVKREGHRDRFAFANKLIGHFKDKIDVFGMEGNFIADKFDGLADYKYSIAIENSRLQGYWSEKIADCYLAHTMPVYYGCPNIHDYYAPESMIHIDIHDFKGSLAQIERAMEENLYEKRREAIMKCRDNVLHQYQIFPFLVNILENRLPLELQERRPRKIHIRTQSPFLIKRDFKIKVHEALIAGKRFLDNKLLGKNKEFRLGTEISRLAHRSN